MYKGISLFSGAGGLDIGVREAGVEVFLSSDIDEDSIKTVQMNCPDTEAVCIDVKKQSFKKFKKEKNLIIFGGPPCQPFSKNGYWVKNLNRDSSSDSRNLLGEFYRSIEEAKPNGFIFENVESMLHPTNKKSLVNFEKELKECGYSTKLLRLNAADFGVPQKRKRVFILGIKGKNKNIDDIEPTHFSVPKGKKLPSNQTPYEGVEKFIKPFNKDKYKEDYEIASEGTYFNEMANVLPGRNYMSLNELGKGYKGKRWENGTRFWNFLYKLHPDQPSITIAAQPGPWVGPFHWENRRLRVPEIAAIQTFPKGYNFYGTRRSIQMQIGNAVPCLLAQRVTEHLLINL